VLLAAQSTIRNLVATPASLSFTSSDPDAGPATSPTVTASWEIRGGEKERSWTLTVSAGSAFLGGCPNIPVTAVRVLCTSVEVPGGGATGACAGEFALSTLPQTVAAGRQGQGTKHHAVNLRFLLNDSWRYIATGGSPCTLNLTYTADAP